MSGTCRWWAHTHDFDETEYFTECPGEPDYHGPYSPLTDDEEQLAIACWEHEAAYCPFCGEPLEYCEEDEVLDDIRADEDYRYFVRRSYD